MAEGHLRQINATNLRTLLIADAYYTINEGLKRKLVLRTSVQMNGDGGIPPVKMMETRGRKTLFKDDSRIMCNH